MPDGNGIERQLGKLIATTENLGASLAQFRAEIKGEFTRLEDTVHGRINKHGERLAALELDKAQAKGAARAVALIWGAIGSAAALAGAFVSGLFGR